MRRVGLQRLAQPADTDPKGPHIAAVIRSPAAVSGWRWVLTLLAPSARRASRSARRSRPWPQTRSTASWCWSRNRRPCRRPERRPVASHSQGEADRENHLGPASPIHAGLPFHGKAGFHLGRYSPGALPECKRPAPRGRGGSSGTGPREGGAAPVAGGHRAGAITPRMRLPLHTARCRSGHADPGNRHLHTVVPPRTGTGGNSAWPSAGRWRCGLP